MQRFMHEWNKTSSRAEEFHWSFHGRMKLKKIRMWVAPSVSLAVLNKKSKWNRFPTSKKLSGRICIIFPRESFFRVQVSRWNCLFTHFVQINGLTMIPLFVRSSKLFDSNFFLSSKESSMWKTCNEQIFIVCRALAQALVPGAATKIKIRWRWRK